MRRPTKREALISGISLAISVVLSVFVIQHRGYLLQISHWGYVGCFIITLLGGGTFVLPGFGIVLTFTLGGILNPAIVGAVAGLGEAIGTIGAYLTGYAGRGLVRDRDSGLYLRFTNIINRHGSKAVFVVTALLSPLVYPFAVLLGTLRFGLVRFFLATWAGDTVKSMVIAYLGYFGLRSVLRWLGVDL
jgi:membrane protein DedA with SNARE-associated domain